MPFDAGLVELEEQAQENLWKLEREIVYTGNTERFTVHRGFVTDLASVPGMFTWLIPRYGKYTKAAILHDALCELARQHRFKRWEADGIFRRSMRELQVSFLRRWIMWAAVRLGGGTEVLRPGAWQLLLVLAIGVPAFAFLLPAAVTIGVTLVLFWLIQWLLYLVFGRASDKERRNVPHLTLPTRHPDKPSGREEFVSITSIEQPAPTD
jgi:hypothetical protein